MKRAVVLLSGGLDSATVVAIARHDGYDVTALTFYYGQEHFIEIERSKQLVKAMEIKNHIVLSLPTEPFTGSSLTGNKGIQAEAGIPSTYVPCRNIVFLSLASALATSIGAEAVFTGINAVDYSGYPDCRPEFVVAFQRMLRVGTKEGVAGREMAVEVPLLRLTKSEIIQRGTDLGVDYSKTHSCYTPRDGKPCRECDSCKIRAKGFAEAGLKDPALG